MSDDVHVNWGMNVCQCVLCILSSLSCLSAYFLIPKCSRVSQVHTCQHSAQVCWNDKPPCATASNKQSPLVRLACLLFLSYFLYHDTPGNPHFTLLTFTISNYFSMPMCSNLACPEGISKISTHPVLG